MTDVPYPTVEQGVAGEGGMKSRNALIYQRRHLAGFTLAKVGQEFGLSVETVRGIVKKEERRRNLWLQRASRRSRPLDMGGPRDQWLTFFPE